MTSEEMRVWAAIREADDCVRWAMNYLNAVDLDLDDVRDELEKARCALAKASEGQ